LHFEYRKTNKKSSKQLNTSNACFYKCINTPLKSALDQPRPLESICDHFFFASENKKATSGKRGFDAV
jgi:hypothetical protein